MLTLKALFWDVGSRLLKVFCLLATCEAGAVSELKTSGFLLASSLKSPNIDYKTAKPEVPHADFKFQVMPALLGSDSAAEPPPRPSDSYVLDFLTPD